MADLPPTLRTNFANGIISHSVSVRTDWARQESSLKEALNFVITPSGAVRKRPGTEYLGDALYVVQDGVLAPPRLVKFEFSLGQTYILEFGDYEMRVWKDDFLVIDPATDEPYKISTPYSYRQIMEATWSQNKDILVFTHWDLPIQQLVRGPSATHTNWYWEAMIIGEDVLQPAPKGVRFTHDGHNGVSYTVTSVKSTQESRGGNEIITTPLPVAPEQPASWPADSANPWQKYINVVGWMAANQAYWGPRFGLPTLDQQILNTGSVGQDFLSGGVVIETGTTTVQGMYLNPALAAMWARLRGTTLGLYNVWSVKNNAGVSYTVTLSLVYVEGLISIQRVTEDVWEWDIVYGNTFGTVYYFTTNMFPNGVYIPGSDAFYWGLDPKLQTKPAWLTPGSNWLGTGPFALPFNASDPAKTTTNVSSTAVRDWYLFQVNTGLVFPNGHTVNSLYDLILSKKYVAPTQTVNNTIAWNPVAGATSYNIYRRTLKIKDPVTGVLKDNPNPLYYKLASTAAGVLSYTDPNVTTTTTDPNLSPPTTGQYFDTPDTYPHVCTFYQQRLIVGSTKKDPLMLGGSVPGLFSDFSESDNPLDTTRAWKFRLLSKTSNPIKHLIPIRSLYVLTQAGAFVSTVTGSMNRSNVNFNQEAYLGASEVPPVIIERTAIYTPINKQMINTLQYSFTDDAFIDDNILSAAQDLLEDQEITSIDFLRPTASILGVTTSNGKLLLCTYIPRQQFTAWTHAVTEGRFVQCCTCTNAEGVDYFYTVVWRDGKYLIERVGDLRVIYDQPTIDNSVYLDSTLYGVFESPVNIVSNLDHLNNKTVYALVDMSVQGPFTVIDGTITLDYPGTEIQVGRPFTATMETLDLMPENIGIPTFIGGRRHVYRAFVTVEKSGDFSYQINDGESYEYVFQDGTSLGLAPKIFTGTIDIPGAVQNTTSTKLRIVSNKPLPLTVNALVAEILYGR